VLERVRRISELSDTILDRAHRIAGAFDRTDEVKERLEGLVVALSQAAERVAAEASEVAEPAEPSVRAVPAPTERGAEGARLVALQMALDGRTRGEIEAKLRIEFELADPAAVVDEVLGIAGARRLIEGTPE
jgi:hypothetical protein